MVGASPRAGTATSRAVPRTAEGSTGWLNSTMKRTSGPTAVPDASGSTRSTAGRAVSNDQAKSVDRLFPSTDRVPAGTRTSYRVAGANGRSGTKLAVRVPIQR